MPTSWHLGSGSGRLLFHRSGFRLLGQSRKSKVAKLANGTCQGSGGLGARCSLNNVLPQTSQEWPAISLGVQSSCSIWHAPEARGAPDQVCGSLHSLACDLHIQYSQKHVQGHTLQLKGTQLQRWTLLLKCMFFSPTGFTLVPPALLTPNFSKPLSQHFRFSANIRALSRKSMSNIDVSSP